MYDIIIIGAGPAGLTAAIYALRSNKKVLILEKSSFGGQMTFSPKIENYPGFLQISGNELADGFVEQVIALGADLELEAVIGIKNDGNLKCVVTENNEYCGKSVIIATGAKHRLLGLERENEFIGEGISFCALCDGAFYNDKTVAVVGGGNSALQEAILLSENCKKVYMIQNLKQFTGEQLLVDILAKKENVEFIMGTVVTSLVGDDVLTAVNLVETESKSERLLEVDGLFVAIGLMPENDAFSNITDLDHCGYIVAKEDCTTNTNGIFVAGDCRTKRVRQITTATADGSVCALAACNYVESVEF